MAIAKEIRTARQIDQEEQCCSYSEAGRATGLIAASIISVFVLYSISSQASRARYFTKFESLAGRALDDWQSHFATDVGGNSAWVD
jgi:hypothetical protein